MANSGRGSNSSGCGALIAAFVVFAIVAAVIGQIARGLTNLSIWTQYGSDGLPDPTNRSPAYPMAWGLFFGMLLFVGLAVATVVHEQSRRRRFNAYVGRLKSPAGAA